MKEIAQMDLGATVLSIAIAAGFVALGFLVLRLLFMGVSELITKFKYRSSLKKEKEALIGKGSLEEVKNK